MTLKNIRNTLALIFFMCLAQYVRAETRESCSRKLDLWLKKNSSSNPFVALSKKGAPSLTLDKIEKSIHDSTYRTLEEFYQQITDPKRMKEITKAIHSIFDDSKSTELVIVLAGEAHLIDAYINRPEDPTVAYTEVNIDNTTHYYSEGLRKYLDHECLNLPKKRAAIVSNVPLLDFKCETSGFGGENRILMEQLSWCSSTVLSDQFAAYVRGTPGIDKDRLLYKEVPLPVGTFPNKIFIGEAHSFDAVDLFAELPSAECLNLLGYSGVKLVFEGIEREVQIDGVTLRNFLERNLYYLVLSHVESMGLITRSGFQYFFSSAVEKMNDPGMAFFPTFLALAEYGTRLASEGVNVTFLGADSENTYGYPPAQGVTQLLNRTIRYKRNKSEHTLVVDPEGVWYTSVHFQRLGKIQFYSGEEEIVINHLVKQSQPPVKIGENFCGTKRCATFRFSDTGEQVTIYSSDGSKFLSLFN